MITRVLVRDIMNSPVVSASADTTINDLAIKMKEERVGSIVVTDRNGDPDGIVTDWDIVSNAVIKDVRPSSIKAKDVMQKLYTIEGEDGVTEAARSEERRVGKECRYW